MVSRLAWRLALVCTFGWCFVPAAAQQQHCDQYFPLRAPWFGYLHVHSSLSLDARLLGSNVAPLDVYRFAQGRAIRASQINGVGPAGGSHVLARALDFAAVTDHAELLGETRICSDDQLAGHLSPYCLGLRWLPEWTSPLFTHTAARARRLSVCGKDGKHCLTAARLPWERLRAAAELAYDRSRRCQFSSFIGYEWTGVVSPERGKQAKLHRNVIFSSANVPDLPVSFVEAPLPDDLYRALADQCDPQTMGCDAVVIPHSSNLSLGLMFQDSGSWPEESGRDSLRLRARYERLVEIIQRQGAAECSGEPDDRLVNDELCRFEQVGDSTEYFSGDFAREGLKRGLRWHKEWQVNPLKFGFVGGTNSLYGLAGDVDERALAARYGEAAGEGVELSEGIEFNPGGLTVLYAEQNRRESLFAAMKRRESYATSGPRMTVRFFGGAALPPDYCDRNDRLEQAYRLGVPMGGDLPISELAPRFAVSAMKDPGVKGSAGVDLQRIQIIKGWLDDEGELHERVFEVAGEVSAGEMPGQDSCAPARGFKTLCQVWQDPQFNPQVPAFYYARVLQQPSCRWSKHVCEGAATDCGSKDALSAAPGACCPGPVPAVIQERAWTSPIWHAPVSVEQ